MSGATSHSSAACVPPPKGSPLGDRVALVTGASSGIGAAVAVQLGRLGARVALVGRRSDLLERTAQEIREDGGVAFPVVADLTSPDAPAEVVEAARTCLGPVGVLVCAAGAVRLGRVEAIQDRQWDLQFRLNLEAPFRMIRAVLPGMREVGQGWVVAVGSAAGVAPVAGTGAYGVSKAALNRLVELVDEENRDRGVRAVCVCPGWVRTGLAADPRDHGVPVEEVLRPADVADTVAWLLTRPSRVRVGPVVEVTPVSPRADVRVGTASVLRDATGASGLTGVSEEEGHRESVVVRTSR